MRDAVGARLDRGLEAFIDTWPDVGERFDRPLRDRLLAYLHLLGKWNRVYNLTAVRDPIEMVDEHVLDSLSLLPWLPAVESGESAEPGIVDMLDIGSGAGLPSLPLAIVRQDLRCVSVESNGKKARFQRQVCLELGLSHVQVRQSRIENDACVARVVTSRAFRSPTEFLQLVVPHCVPGGRAVLMLARAAALPDDVPECFELETLCRARPHVGEKQRHLAIYRRR